MRSTLHLKFFIVYIAFGFLVLFSVSAIAPQMLKAGLRYGLNGLALNPSFEEFNTPIQIDQPFKWDDRLY